MSHDLSQNSQTKIQQNIEQKSQIGVIGLAVMGANLARNLASKGFRTSIFNRTFQKTQDLLDLQKSEIKSKLEKRIGNSEANLEDKYGEFVGFETLEEFVNSLESPRKIILMVKSGVVVDEFLEKLKPLLDSQDIVLDCGNSNWKDTQRRQKSLEISPANIKISVNSSVKDVQNNLQTPQIQENNLNKNLIETSKNQSKTLHLIGIFSQDNLENWAKITQNSNPKFDKIILHLIATSQNGKENETKLVEIWQEFTIKHGEKFKNFENKIFLGSIVGFNYLQNQKTEKQETLNLTHYFHTLLDYKFIDKFDSGDNQALCNYFYDKNRKKYLINLKKYLTELDEKWLYRTPNHPPNTEDANFFCYSEDSHHFFGKNDKTDREKLGNLKTDITWIIDYHETKWNEKNIDKNDFLPSYFLYIPVNEKNLPKNQINKNETICLINSQNSEKTLAKFTEILVDLNKEFELNLEILTDFKSGNLENEIKKTDNKNIAKNDSDQEIDKIQNQKQHFHLISCGVSGGEEGALNGPSIMPSGEPEIVNQLLPILEKIAACDFDGKPCVTNIGLGASGHFVKMVHNGIEYALMQGIAEIYDILSYNSYSNAQIREVFIELNQGETKSFLLEITIKILETQDSLADGFLLDKIKDQAGAKGTGSWTVEAALELGVAVPTIAAAVFARTMSARNQSFNANKKIVRSINVENIHRHTDYEKRLNSEGLFEILQKLLYSTFLVSYLQGLDLIVQVDNFYKWRIDISEICRIWQGGCIIRSKMLENLDQYFFGDFRLQNDFSNDITLFLYHTIDYRSISNTPKPVIHSVFDYILSITNKNLPTNLIQAQRDFFGAHTYERTDKPGTFSGGWKK